VVDIKTSTKSKRKKPVIIEDVAQEIESIAEMEVVEGEIENIAVVSAHFITLCNMG
jgi:hypothetical protein